MSHASWSRRDLILRGLCTLGLALSALAPVALHLARRADAALGPVRLEEILSLGLGPEAVIRQDLVSAQRRTRDEASRKVTLPDAWASGARRGRVPSVLLFVDGEPVAVAGYEGGVPPSGRPDGYFYAVRDAPQKQLAVRCVPRSPCGEAFVVRDDLGFELRLGRARLRRAGFELPLLAVALLAVGTSGFIIFRVRRAAPATALALLLSGAWIAMRLDTWAWSDRLLIAMALAMSIPALRAMARRLGGATAPTADAALRRAADRFGPATERWVPGLAVLVVGSLLAPMALRGRAFFMEWSNNLYYVARQAESWKELGHPSYFLHTDLSGVFYPYYLFYGGTLYALTSALAALVGSPFAAYVGVFGLGFAMAWVGFFRLGRESGLSRADAALPGLVFVTSAYYLTNAYARGTWHELVATSAVPLVAAACASLLRRPAGAGSVAWLLAAVVVLTGSHTITLLWGTTFLVLVAGVVIFGLGRSAALPFGRAAAIVILASLLALALNSWFLVPAMTYARYTHIGGYAAHGFGSDCWFFNLPGVLFHGGRETPAQSSTPALYVQVSIYALAWALAVAWSRWASADRSLRRIWAGLLGLLLVFLILILRDPWPLVPWFFKIIQFQFRLNTYVALLVAALVLVGLHVVRRSPHRPFWTLSLAAALAIQIGLAEYQVWSAPTYFTLDSIVGAGTKGPPSLTEARDYRFLTKPRGLEGSERVFFPEPEAQVTIDPASVHGEEAVVVVPEGVSEPVVTNVAYSPFITAQGAAIVAGRTREGWTVLARSDGRTSGEWRATIRRGSNRAARLGMGLSVVAAVGAVLLLLWRCARPVRARARP